MRRLLLILFLSSLIAGCASDRQYRYVNTTSLSQLESLNAYNAPSSSSSDISNIRLQAIKETATSLGAQAGLAAKSQQINKVLDKNTAQLDRIFNFNALLLNHNVLPPVLEQSNQLLNLDGPNAIRIADKTYKIVSQARFVTTPPNWRQYLYMDYKKPDVPDRTLLPRNESERSAWIKYLNLGWKSGTSQARTIYLADLSRLERDYKGMLLYRELLDRNMVSKPYVATTNLGVTSNSNDSQIYINDKVLRITALPKLNPNSKQWRSVLTNDDD